MTQKQKINILLAHAGITQAELASRIGTSPSNLNQKIKRESLTNDELQQIAKAVNASWEAYFLLPDGTRI